MPDLSDDERMLLTVLAGLPERFGLYDALGAALPPKPSGPRLGARRQWSGQWEATMKRWDVLKQAGMVHIVGYDVECRGNLFAVTEAGREALAGNEGAGVNLTTDERTVLEALADADEPTALRNLMVRIDPSESVETWSASVHAWANLRAAGLVVGVPKAAGEVRLSKAGRYVVTNVGRAALAERA